MTKKGVGVDCPVPLGPIADSHTHLTSLRHIEPGMALARAALAGVRFLVTVVDPTDDATDPDALLADLASWRERARAIAESWELPADAIPDVRLLVGCHPHDAKDFDHAAHDAMARLLAEPICCGVGEIGLDYHYDNSPRDEQRAVFAEQLDLAVELDAPLSLHIREAHDEAYEIMVAHGIPKAGAVLHCFDLGPEVASRFIDLGCHLGIGGAVTFTNCEPTRQAVRACPANRIVTETDAPYMAPVPLRGTRCEPAYVALSCDFVARLRQEECGEDPSELERVFYDEARRLFDTRAGFDVPQWFRDAGMRP